MNTNISSLMQQLWQDDCGGVITGEYLLLGSVLTFGTVSGMSAMRDATVEEMKESANSIRSVREHYTPRNLTSQRASNTDANSQGQASCANGFCP